MLYFSIIVLFLIPYFSSFIKKNFKINMNSTSIILSILAIFQIILSPLTLSMTVNYSKYVWIIAMILILLLFSCLFFLVYNVKIKKEFSKFNKSLKSIFYENISITCFLIIGLIFILFIKYTSHDTTFYISISDNFKTGIYSGNGTDLLPNHYRVPSMYFTYAALFPNNIYESYYLLNPLIYMLIVFDLAKQVSKIFNLKSQKIKILIEQIIMISFLIGTIASLISITQMNVLMYSILTIYFIISIYRKTNFNVLAFSILGIGFFSSTGILLALPLSIAFSVYVFFIHDIKYSIRYIYLPIVAIIYCIFLFLNLNNISIILLLIPIFICFWYMFYLKYIYKPKDSKIIFNVLENKKWFIYASTIFYLLILIFAFVYWTFLYKSPHYNHNLGYFTLAIGLVIIILNICYKYKITHSNSSIIFFVFIAILISTSEMGILNLFNDFKNNQSIWRLNFLTLGFTETINDIVFIVLIISSWTFNLLVNSSIKKYKLQNIILLLSFSSSLVVPSLSISHNYKNLSIGITSNVFVNLNKLSTNDIALLSNLNMNYNSGFISDGPFDLYIKGVDVTRWMTYPTYQKLLSNHQWNFDNFVFGMKIWNSNFPDDAFDVYDDKINNEFDENKTSHEIIKLLDSIIKNISSLSLISLKNHQAIDSIKYIILQNKSFYYNNIMQYSMSNGNEKKFKFLTKGDNITIFTTN